MKQGRNEKCYCGSGMKYKNCCISNTAPITALMTNQQIAHMWAKKKKSEMTPDGIWISDNLPSLSAKERKEILSIFKTYYKFVDYNSKTGVCKCSDVPITDKIMDGEIVLVGKDTGGDHGQPVNPKNYKNLIGPNTIIYQEV